MKILILICIILILIILLCINSKETYSSLIPIPARRMWGWGADTDLGYCGETCVQSIGLYYGNYISQGIVNLACGGKVDGRTFLLGSTSKTAMKALNFNMIEETKIFSLDSIRTFLDQTINQQGFPIIMGWYDWTGNDDQYDHIMTTIGYNKDSDTIYFLDNYLLEVSEGNLEQLFQNRNKCNSKADSIPQPLIYCVPKQISGNCTENINCIKSKNCSCNYFLVVTGNVDPQNELLPVSLSVDRPDEPDWGLQDGINQKPVQINAIATVSKLTVGQNYILLRFDGTRGNSSTFINPVPSKNFLNSCQDCQKYPFTADSSSKIIQNNLTTGLWSDGSYFFRCVKA